MNKALVVCGLVLSLGTPSLASAEPGTLIIQGSRELHGNQRAVSYADLELASAIGQRTLHNRVGLAIADLCDPSRFSVAEPQDAMKCAAQAWTDIRPRLDQLAPRLASR